MMVDKKKLKCKPGNYQCGKRCMSHKKRCRVELQEEAREAARQLFEAIELSNAAKARPQEEAKAEPKTFKDVEADVKAWQEQLGFDSGVEYDMHDTSHILTYQLADTNSQAIQEQYGFPDRTPQYAEGNGPSYAEEVYVTLNEAIAIADSLPEGERPSKEDLTDMVWQFALKSPANSITEYGFPGEAEYYYSPQGSDNETAWRDRISQMYDELSAKQQDKPGLASLLGEGANRYMQLRQSAITGKWTLRERMEPTTDQAFQEGHIPGLSLLMKHIRMLETATGMRRQIGEAGADYLFKLMEEIDGGNT